MYILSNLTLIVSQNIIFIFSRRKQKREKQEKEEEYKNSLLCRFVVDGLGKKVGESVAINHDLLIIKSKDKYLGVPLKHIQEEEKTLLVKGLIDNSKAESLGEKWKEQNFKEISHNINVE